MKTKIQLCFVTILLLSMLLVTQQGCKKNTPENSNYSQNKGKFKDNRDGKIYKWVKIGNQIWMAENLNYETADSWWYDNNSSNGDVYGILYTWDAALTACPSGWHLPSDDEWDILVNYLGGSDVAGGKMKEAGTTHWDTPNTDATNESGFTALPGGFRPSDWSFDDLGSGGYWWSSSESSGAYAWGRDIGYDGGQVGRDSDGEANGHSIRCLKN